jgi:hypothetical protein
MTSVADLDDFCPDLDSRFQIVHTPALDPNPDIQPYLNVVPVPNYTKNVWPF